MTQWGPCALCHVSEVQGMPFWPATYLHRQNDWTGWQNGVNDDVCAQASFFFAQIIIYHMLITGKKNYLCGVFG